MTDEASFAELTVDRLLDRLSSREPAPGGGSVAAIAVAMSASLCAMAARYSDSMLDGAAGIVAEAEVARDRATRLADEDAAAYRAVLAAGRLRGGSARDSGLRAALSAATDVPAAVTTLAAEVARLAVRVSTSGNPNLRGDSLTALLLAEGAARSAAELVRINLASAGTPGDPRGATADRLVDEIAALAAATVPPDESDLPPGPS